MASPAFAIIRGDADPRPVSLHLAERYVAYWTRALDLATDELLDADGAAELTSARWHVSEAHDRLCAARARRDRVRHDLAGRRWLHVAGPEDEARIGW